MGEVFLNGGHQGIQSLAAHAGGVERLIQRRGKTSLFSKHDDLVLDVVQGKCHGVLDLRIAGKLRFVGGLAYGGIRGIGQIPEFRQGGRFSVEFIADSAGQVRLKIPPGGTAGGIHSSCQSLFLVGEQVGQVVFCLTEQEKVFPDYGAVCRQRLRIFDAAQQFFRSRFGSGGLRVDTHDPGQLGFQFAVFRIDGAP